MIVQMNPTNNSPTLAAVLGICWLHYW